MHGTCVYILYIWWKLLSNRFSRNTTQVVSTHLSGRPYSIQYLDLQNLHQVICMYYHHWCDIVSLIKCFYMQHVIQAVKALVFVVETMPMTAATTTPIVLLVLAPVWLSAPLNKNQMRTLSVSVVGSSLSHQIALVSNSCMSDLLRGRRCLYPFIAIRINN